MLNESRLYSFIDVKNGFNIYFAEGQKTISELAILRSLEKEGFSFYRDTILGSIHIVNFLKPGENTGYYIDSEEPYFRYKLEINNGGDFRCLLLPEGFEKFPTHLTGKVRLTKVMATHKNPYTSVIELNQHETKDIFNKVLEDSYQTQSKIIISEVSDQSIMVRKLPPEQIDRELLDDDISLEEYCKKFEKIFEGIFKMCLNDVQPIVEEIESHGFQYLQSKNIVFKCPCSKEQMAYHISRLAGEDVEEIFKDGDIDIKCDYCLTDYQISKKDTEQSIN